MNIQELSLDQIKPPRLQPRLQDRSESIAELAASIVRHGLISPLTVTPDGDGYRLLAGNRRLKALQSIGAPAAVCNVVEVDDSLGDEITIAENLIRLNLSPVEEAYAFALHLDRTGESHQELAQHLNQERTYVTRRLLLLDLDNETLGALEDGTINLSQALLLRRIDDPEIREKFIRHATEYGANVRVMTHWVANYEKDAARIRAAEGREPTPQDIEPARQVYMECDRCGEPTSYDVLRPVYLCPACKRLLAQHRIAGQEV